MRVKIWEPFKNYKPLYRGFDGFFDEVVKGITPEEVYASGSWHPNVDVYETEESYVLKAELPGIDKKEIKIDINDDTLTLQGEKKLEEKVEKEKYVRIERRYGSFSRSFALSDKLDRENITANYKDGVLEITIPKKEEAKPKEIKVEVN